ncbi:MAG: transporter [Frankiales bacterium]|nr:transporter [Frankiales bacterium]
MSAPEISDRPESIFSARYRLTTLGVIVLMTIIAFEAMAVATALPTAARDLHGLSAYGWSFTGFLIASVIGMVAAGMHSDWRGPRASMTAGLPLFVAGLIIGGLAPQMWVLIAGRVIQGLASGLLITSMYVTMGAVYSDAIRPRIFGALASAWVVPGLVGPVVAGSITQNLSWRWVFAGLVPFVIVGGLLMAPSLAQMQARPGAARPRLGRLGFAVLTAAGIACVANIGEDQNALSWIAAAAGLVAMVIGLRQLLPTGTFTFAAGVPSAVAFRGVLAGTFFGMESIVPLTLTVEHHYSATMSGLPLTLTAVSWAAASQLQGHWRNPNRPLLVAIGLALTGVAGGGMALVASGALGGWAAFIAWPAAGFGAGFALTSASVVMLEFTTDADRGSDSSSLQLADSSASALCSAFAGAFVAAAAHGRISYHAGLAAVFVVLAVLGLLAIAFAPRLRAPAGAGAEATSAALARAGSSVPTVVAP